MVKGNQVGMWVDPFGSEWNAFIVLKTVKSVKRVLKLFIDLLICLSTSFLNIPTLIILSIYSNSPEAFKQTSLDKLNKIKEFLQKIMLW